MPAKVKGKYRSARIIGGDRMVLNIGGTNYRFVVVITYPARAVFSRFLGTHAVYDALDVEEV